MANAIVYCDSCSRIILPGQLAHGEAVQTRGKSICPECMRSLSPEMREEFMSPAPQARGARHGTDADIRKEHATGRRGRVANKSGSHMFAIMSVLGVLVGASLIVIIHELASDKGGAPPSRQRSPPRLPPATGPDLLPVPATAGQGTNASGQSSMQELPSAPVHVAPAGDEETLDDIRAMLNPQLSKYADMRAALTYYIGDHLGKSSAAEAQTLLAEIDAKYAERADSELRGAIEAASDLVSKKRHDDACSLVRAIRSRFGVGPWLAEGGEKRVAAALAEIDAARPAPSAQPAGPKVVAKGTVLYSVDFEKGLPDQWKGRLETAGLLAGSKGAVRQAGGKDIESPGSWSPTFFTVGPDTYFSYSYKMDSHQWHQIVICMRHLQTSKNLVLFHADNSRRESGKWHTIAFALKQCTGAIPRAGEYGVYRLVWQTIQNSDRGLTVDNVLVTEGAPDDEP